MARIAAYDTDGQFLAAVDEGVAKRALATREVVRIPEGVRLRTERPLRQLTGEEKRRIELAKQRA